VLHVKYGQNQPLSTNIEYNFNQDLSIFHPKMSWNNPAFFSQW